MRCWITRILTVLVLLAMALGIGCKPKTEAPSTEKSGQSEAACEPAPAWLGWLLQDPKAAATVQALPEPWVALYQGELWEALAEPPGEDLDIARRRVARVRFELSALYGRLHAVLVEAKRRYHAQRSQLQVADTPRSRALSAYFETGQKPEISLKGVKDADYEAWRRYLGLGCERRDQPYALQAWACLKANQDAPACPAKPRSLKLSPKIAERFAAYGRLLCSAGPAQAETEAVRRLAGEPLFVDALEGEGDLKAELRSYDPLAFWVLSWANQGFAEARLAVKSPTDLALGSGHLPKAQAGLDPASMLFAKGGFTSAAPDAAGVQAAAKALQTRVDRAIQCAKQPKMTQLIDELSLRRAFADGMRLSAARRLLLKGDCTEALALFHAVLNPSETGPSYQNPPTFWADLAAARMCKNQNANARSALERLKTRFPEVIGVIEGLESLAIVRLMGGAGGDQKTQ